ncbi:ferredoxin family 2Fe-2S iron-sulfur cluster binding protein [Sphingosinicella ginsenosidimutans]|uniref:2Fe-2S iron-sulfur cluster binding domain-containing protein n=1 Tax=Allosphingosinicella ginsenosidimutans TaxID=1176539 RepID=A0A5C6TVI5_9SPHN|nr:2Fe-2S iron-sulfur cluster-binding protein [Sphingosinicella ginsenosidimutans]TXC64249.1 2Fe-2S iron-sulfur cluster binding domain-containing protein [Sphingosinicella ginsenosidimutans]
MTLVRFISADGASVLEADAAPGERLLDVGQRLGLPLEGTCEGQMACSTCHVIVAAEDFAKLPPASEEEEDMLDLASHVTRHSRLSCQLYASEAFETLTLHIPGGVHNMQGR